MRYMMTLVIFLGLLAGCGTNATTGGQSGATAPAAEPTTATVQLPEAAPALAALARHLGQQPDAVRLVKAEQVEWPNSGLGCPAPDMAYLQVITPGYKLTVEVAGKQYEVHTDETGSQVVLCEGGQPTSLTEAGAPAETQDNGMGQRAAELLARHLGLPLEQVQVVSVEPAEWGGDMGCPEPAVSYMAILMQGYNIRLQAQGTQYEVHTTQDLSQALMCPDGKPINLLEPAQDTSAPGSGSGTPAGPVSDKAAAALAQHLGLPLAQVLVVRVEPMEWPDSSLGCPDPAALYAPAITPGYTFTIKAGESSYDVRANETASVLVLCQDGKPTTLQAAGGDAPAASTRAPARQQTIAPTSPPATSSRPAAATPKPAARPAAATSTPAEQALPEESMSETDRLVASARMMLAQELGIAPEAIQVRSVEAVEWSSSALGCEQPGQAYLTVIVPGYRIVLEHAGHMYEYHTDRGSQIIRCDPGPR